PQLRIRDAAALLGVSDDTARRWAESGRLPTTKDGAGRSVVEGADLAENLRFLCPNCHSQTPTFCRKLCARGESNPHALSDTRT
ncbi:MAG: binding domain, excisionase family, partial [Frankiales bacterium]|nr:binding domain, excisionase family [Frankiales bacterium]